MPNLRDLMTPEDQELVKKWADERRNPKYKPDIPMPLYVCAQLGYYYGWQAVVDYRRGYQIGYKPNGEIELLEFKLEDAVALIKAAEKVHYRQMMDNGRVDAATNLSSHDKKYARNNRDYVNKLAKDAYS